MTMDRTNLAGKVVVITGASSGPGRVDVILNNAGLMPHSPLERRRIEDWNRSIDVPTRSRAPSRSR